VRLPGRNLDLCVIILAEMQTSVPLTDLPPPPRRLFTRPRPGGRPVWVFRLILLPFFLLNSYLALLVVGQILAQAYGRVVNATIVEKKAARHHSYSAICEYHLDGVYHRNKEWLSEMEFGALNTGDVLQIKAISLFGCGFSVQNASRWSQTLRDAALILLWEVAFSPFMFLLYILPPIVGLAELRAALLLRHGIAVGGVIISIQKTPNDATMFFVSYQFRTIAGATLSARRYVDSSEYPDAKVGFPITVIYSKVRPSHSTPYEFSKIKVRVDSPR